MAGTFPWLMLSTFRLWCILRQFELLILDEDCRTTVWTYKNGDSDSDSDGGLDSFQPDEKLKKKKKMSYVRRRRDVYKTLGYGSVADSVAILAFGSLFTAPYKGSELYIDIHESLRDRKIQSLIKKVEFLPCAPEIMSAGKRYASDMIQALFLCAQLRLLDGQFKNHRENTFSGLYQKLESLSQEKKTPRPIHVFVMTDLPESNWTGTYLGDLSKNSSSFKLHSLREQDEVVLQTQKKLASTNHGQKFGSIPMNLDSIKKMQNHCPPREVSNVQLYIEEAVCSCASLGFIGTAGSTIADSVELMRKFNACSKTLVPSSAPPYLPMLPHSYTVDSLSQSQDLATAILAASTPSNISAACSSLESFLQSHTPDQCRHFFSITFPSLICKLFGFGDPTAGSPAQSPWIDVIAAGNDLGLAERVFSLLSPSGILMSSIFAVDKLSLVKYVFPTERLPEYARFMLSSDKDRSALSNLCPFLKGKIEEDSLRGSSYEVRVNVFEYYMFWLSYYPVCRGNIENSSVIPIQKRKMFRLENWTLIKGFPGSNKRDSDHKLECNLYTRILYSYLKAFVPVLDLNAHQPYRSSLLHYGNGYDGSVMARAEFLVNVFVHYWLVENDFSPFPVVAAKSFGVAPPFRSAVEEIPPTCGLEEGVKLLVKYLNLSWVTSGAGSENYIEYGESPRWKTPTSGSSFHAANLSLRPLTSWNTHLQRPLYRYLLRSFLFCPIGSSIKNASQVFSIWVMYLEPWLISLDDFSNLEAALNGSVKDVKKEESYESCVYGYTSLWQSYVISNYLYYSSLVMHFIGFAHKFLHTDPEIITQMVLKVMSILTSSRELLVLMKNIDKAFHSKQTGPGNSTVNELSRFVPSIREQLKDWEDGLCESNADGSFLHENWNKDLKLFGDSEDGGQQLLQLFILRAEAELQAVSEKNLSEALKCVDSLKTVVSNFFGGHVIKPIAFSLEPDHPHKIRDELFKPRGAGNQIAGSVKYKGDWMTRPVSEDEVAWMAKLVINISIWLNDRLGLNKPDTNKDKKESSESVSYVDISEEDARSIAGPGDAARMMLRGIVMVCGSVLQLMRKYGVRVNLRVMASKKFMMLLFLYVVFAVLKRIVTRMI
ncbi:hypothetical protein AALP_AA6G104400 [Arabis alpina]|uniref:Uncharacterized protein n=1 Tax=Arabis alpina TaxID=50452 RepID=A0A087GNC6_ARAAL|nr:hypothetical protein AALP_AA6G104400 [Arabis alpina]